MGEIAWWGCLFVAAVLLIVFYKCFQAHWKAKAATTILNHLETFEKLVAGKVYSGRDSEIVKCLAFLPRGNSFYEMEHIWISRNGNWFTTVTMSGGSRVTSFELTPLSVGTAKELLSPHPDTYKEFFGEPEKA